MAKTPWRFGGRRRACSRAIRYLPLKASRRRTSGTSRPENFCLPWPSSCSEGWELPPPSVEPGGCGRFPGHRVVPSGGMRRRLHGGLMAEWYLVTWTPVVWLVFFTGLARMAELTPRPWGVAPAVAAGAVVAIQCAGLNLGRDGSRPWLLPRSVWMEREDLYRQAAWHLSRSCVRPSRRRPGNGALGYFCGCRIFDTVGLVSPSALASLPLASSDYIVNYAVPSALVQSERPDIS